jgi:hypothetical protein
LRSWDEIRKDLIDGCVRITGELEEDFPNEVDREFFDSLTHIELIAQLKYLNELKKGAAK